MRFKTIAAVVSLLCFAGSSQVLAPKPTATIVPSATVIEPNFITACAKSLLNRQSLINTTDVNQQDHY